MAPDRTFKYRMISFKPALIMAGAAALFAGTALAAPVPVFHWPVSSLPVTTPIINSLPTEMTSELNYAVAAWNQSAVIEAEVQNLAAPGNSCNPVLGKIRVCLATDNNPFYATNQLYYTPDGHLMSVRAVVHDYFMDTAPNNTVVGRRAVFCYLVGVSFGAVPQDLDANNSDIVDASGQQSCMDATTTPEGNESPTPVDLAALAELYSHTHTDFGIRDLTSGAVAAQQPQLPTAATIDANPGAARRFDKAGRPIEFERVLPNGVRVVTRVLASQ